MAEYTTVFTGMALATGSMEWLRRGVADGMRAGTLPHVPEARKLEQSLFPVRLHPQHASLHEDFFNWARSFLGSSEKEMEKMHRRAVPSLPCYLWPTTSDPQRSLTLIKLMHWFTLVDEAVDEGAGLRGDVQAVERLCKGLIQELLGTSSFSEATPGPAQGEHLQQLHKKPLVVTVGWEWWDAVRRADIPQERKMHLAAELNDFLMAQVEIARFRADLLYAGKPPTLKEYIITRRAASAFLLGLAMIEYAMGDQIHELDEETLNSPMLKQLRDAVSDHGCWLNDIISFPKEFNQGDFLSLLPLLHIRNNAHCPFPSSDEAVPFRMAVAQAWEMTAARERDCCHLAREILDSARPAAKPVLQEYVEIVYGFTSGNWAWSLECPAYVNLQELHGPSRVHKELTSLGGPHAFPTYSKLHGSSDEKMTMKVRAPQSPHASLLLPKKPSSCFVTGTSTTKVTKNSLALQLPTGFRTYTYPFFV